ncbi:PaaX family transcriptional regulator C-terminal domain-containing protein [Duganella sp. Dugasp56]|uniref:PaaX family transcriptional regulator C-terminal domain-containing protein n=1 Tax=Duganella sp. Dugasp56 TaxID=3243046 RepID=UPI0039B110B0
MGQSIQPITEDDYDAVRPGRGGAIMNAAVEHYLNLYLGQARPRLRTMLRLMFSSAQEYGHKSLWLGSAIELMRPLGFQQPAVRAALFRLGVHQQLRVERHGRHSLCTLTPAANAAILTARQRLNTPPERSFAEDWTMLINSGGISSARYARVRRQLLGLDYCLLAPNVLARPAGYANAMPSAEDHGLALFHVCGSQLAAAVRQPLFGLPEWDFDGAAALYQQFEERFAPLLPMMGRHDAIDDEQAYLIQLLVSHGYQHCRQADPLLPQELLPDAWPATTAYRTYAALYNGCAEQARRHLLSVTAAPDRPAAAGAASRACDERLEMSRTA